MLLSIKSTLLCIVHMLKFTRKPEKFIKKKEEKNRYISTNIDFQTSLFRFLESLACVKSKSMVKIAKKAF